MAGKIDFGTVTMGSPAWYQDSFDPDTNVVRFPAKLDPTQFEDVKSVKVVLTANAAIDAVALAVTALTDAIPSGTVIDFGAKKFARLTAAAAKGAVALTVAALATALVIGDTGYYRPKGTRKQIPSGTFVGRTVAERLAGTAFGPAASADDEVYLILRDVPDANVTADIEMLKPQRHVKENFLPDWTAISANAPLLAKLRATYICITGIA